jgi:putative membrane protein
VNLTDLPAVNAGLNSLSTLFLVLGYVFIRQRKELAHRNCMVAAFITSTLFLASYLFYHFFAGRTVFREPEWFRPIYLLILLTHTVLAVAIVPMIFLTLIRAYRGMNEAHRRIARWTWPLWIYVSATGVLIYLLLYQIFPQSAP